MARFLFIWMIMIGAMVGVRESTHFDVDVWPELGAARQRAAAHRHQRVRAGLRAGLRLVGHRVRAVRLEPDLGARRAAAGGSSSPGRWPAHLDRVPRRALPRRPAHPGAGRGGARMSGGGAVSPAIAALILFGVFFALMALRVPIAFALGLACLPDPAHRAAAVADDPVQRDLQRLQLVHPAGGAVLPADRQPDERRRHHRPAGAPVARPGRAPSRRAGAGQRGAVDLLRRHLRARRPPTPRARARSSSRRRSRKATTSPSRSRSPRCRRCWR